MPARLAAVPPPPPDDPTEGLPEAWSASARTTYVEIVREHPSLGAVELATVYEAAALLAAADAFDELVAADGFVTRGSQGQPVPHPLIAESRLHRTAALAALRALGLGRGQSGASAAGAALASKRHHGRTASVRVAP